MSRYHSYLNSAVAILRAYEGGEPFSAYLKKYFAANKKYGSSDRKTISHICYSYFRTAGLWRNENLEEKILRGFFLCSNGQTEFLEAIRPAWNAKASTPLLGKLHELQFSGELSDLFPMVKELSSGIDPTAFAGSMLTQPDLFIRIRPGHRPRVIEKLELAGLPYQNIEENTLSLPNGSRLEGLFEIDHDIVIQDLSSQRVGELIKEVYGLLPANPVVWDCCAASGGKSIMATDFLKPSLLLVSDIRNSILANLEKRFRAAGIKNYKRQLIDLTKDQAPGEFMPNLVIADLPCSGSGTWGRTPEQLLFFREELIGDFALKQKKILRQVSVSLGKGGFLLYITCSAFRKENEEITDYVSDELDLTLARTKLLCGYQEGADTMYAALFRKVS